MRQRMWLDSLEGMLKCSRVSSFISLTLSCQLICNTTGFISRYAGPLCACVCVCVHLCACVFAFRFCPPDCGCHFRSWGLSLALCARVCARVCVCTCVHVFLPSASAHLTVAVISILGVWVWISVAGSLLFHAGFYMNPSSIFTLSLPLLKFQLW